MTDEEFNALPKAKQDLDRLPPHSIEAEQGVLGCCLLSPTECIGECVDKLTDGSASFYDLRHQVIYGILLSMHDAGKPVEIVSVMLELKSSKKLEDAGGIEYLSELPNKVPSHSNIDYYIQIVREKYALRRLVATCTKAVSKAMDGVGDTDALLEEVDSGVREILDDGAKTATVKTAQQLILSVNAAIEKAIENKGQTPGIATGYPDFDARSGGLLDGEMVVIAARPSVGKSSWALNIAVNVAKDGYPVMFFSLEMTAESLMTRALCSESKVSIGNVRYGNLTDHEITKLAESSVTLASMQLLIDDGGGLSVGQIRARARRARQKYGIKLFVIDYIQLMHSTSKRFSNQQEEVSDISNQIKAMAKELCVPVIALSQLNRESEKYGNGKPKISELRNSGSLEQDADVIAMLYPHDQSTDDAVITVGMIVGKSRNGSVGENPLVFFKHYTRFESHTQV